MKELLVILFAFIINLPNANAESADCSHTDTFDLSVTEDGFSQGEEFEIVAIVKAEKDAIQKAYSVVDAFYYFWEAGFTCPEGCTKRTSLSYEKRTRFDGKAVMHAHNQLFYGTAKGTYHRIVHGFCLESKQKDGDDLEIDFE